MVVDEGPISGQYKIDDVLVVISGMTSYELELNWKRARRLEELNTNRLCGPHSGGVELFCYGTFDSGKLAYI